MPFDGYQSRYGDIERLLDARSRIAEPSHWIKRAFKSGNSYCTVGALMAACGNDGMKALGSVEGRLVKLLANELPRRQRIRWRMTFQPAQWVVMAFNDDPKTVHADVLALFDRAIARLEATSLIAVEA